MYDPSTSAGRVYTATKAFVIYLIMSIYVANLAAALTTGQNVVQLITGIDSFVATGLNLCSRNNSAQLSWLNENYPKISAAGLLLAPGPDSASTLNSVLTGECAGAISTSADYAWLLGTVSDPNGLLCDLVPVGPVLYDNILSLPLTANTTLLPEDGVSAIARLVSYAVSGGNYSAGAKDIFMPSNSNRPVCDPVAAANAGAVALATSGQLQLVDLAGIFIIQGVGLVFACLIHISKPARKAATSRLHRNSMMLAGVIPPSLSTVAGLVSTPRADDNEQVVKVERHAGAARAEALADEVLRIVRQRLAVEAADDAREAPVPEQRSREAVVLIRGRAAAAGGGVPGHSNRL